MTRSPRKPGTKRCGINAVLETWALCCAIVCSIVGKFPSRPRINAGSRSPSDGTATTSRFFVAAWGPHMKKRQFFASLFRRRPKRAPLSIEAEVERV